MHTTGEHEMGLRKISDMTRLMSLVLLLLHCYYYCYRAFELWGWTHPLSNRLLANLSRTGLFSSFFTAKAWALGLLLLSLLGVSGKKDTTTQPRSLLWSVALGLLLYGGSHGLLHLPLEPQTLAIGYMGITLTGYLLLMAGLARLGRLVTLQLSGDIFNEENETFPQEERLLQNPYSINLPALYKLRGKERKSWINIINPFRGLLVLGSPGSGKSYYVIREVIRQHLQKGFTMFLYDFKWDELSRQAYHWLQVYQKHYVVPPSFYVINFDDLAHSHRSNPLAPEGLLDITDAAESARSILLGLNRAWIHKQGDFFVESPINFLTAVIWFLKQYESGRYCTLPHALELMQAPYERLFPLLGTVPEIELLVNPFVTAYENDAMEQLEGQVGSAKVGLARLSSPQLYWVLSGNDFTLDINRTEAPKVLCMGNNPDKQQVYGAVLSLYISRMVRLVNQKGRLPCSLVFDEFPTIFFNHMDALMATARSNKVATTLGMQDFSQLKKDYGREQAEVIMNITGNLISGQVTGETAKLLSERFGKIMQERESVSIHRTDTSVNHSRQLEAALPPSRMASLSSGEFVGLVADDPHQKIRRKMFHAEILGGGKEREHLYMELPKVRDVTPEMVMDNYFQIKTDVQRLLRSRTKVSRPGAQTQNGGNGLPGSPQQRDKGLSAGMEN